MYIKTYAGVVHWWKIGQAEKWINIEREGTEYMYIHTYVYADKEWKRGELRKRVVCVCRILFFFCHCVRPARPFLTRSALVVPSTTAHTHTHTHTQTSVLLAAAKEKRRDVRSTGAYIVKSRSTASLRLWKFPCLVICACVCELEHVQEQHRLSNPFNNVFSFLL